MGFGLKAWNQLVRTQETWETRDKASSLWNIQEPCQILVLLSKVFSSQEKKVFKIASAFYLSFTSDTKVFQLIVNMCLKHRSPSYLKKHDTCLFLQRVGTFYCRIRIFKKSGSTQGNAKKVGTKQQCSIFSCSLDIFGMIFNSILFVVFSLRYRHLQVNHCCKQVVSLINFVQNITTPYYNLKLVSYKILCCSNPPSTISLQNQNSVYLILVACAKMSFKSVTHDIIFHFFIAFEQKLIVTSLLKVF